jgi:type I restriction enzyme S subunit
MASEPPRILGDVVSLIRGTTYKSVLLGQPGPLLLGLASIQRNGGFRSDSLKTYGGESKPKLLLRPGDIYVSLKDVTQSADLLGAVARVPKEVELGRLTQDTVKLEFVDDSYPPELVYWVLRSPNFRSYCRAHATGTTNLGLPREDFLAYSLPAPRREVLSLVQLLEAIEQRIDLLTETNATLEVLAQTLFKSWFVDFDPVRAKAEGREPEGMDVATAALFPDEFEDSEFGPIPKGWRTGTLNDLVELKYGKALKASERREGPIPVYGSGGVTGSHDAALVLAPTIIVGRKGTVGSLFWQTDPCFPIDTVFFVRPKKSLHFSYSAMRRMGLERLNTDAAVPGLNRENAYRQPVVIPSDGLLHVWDELVIPMRQKIDESDRKRRTLETIRDALLPRLISGKLRLPEIDTLLKDAEA